MRAFEGATTRAWLFLRSASFPRRTVQLALRAFVGASTACGDCVLVGTYGVNASVMDAVTKRAPDSAPTMTLTDGEYVESVVGVLRDQYPVQLYGAVERPGVYKLEVRAPGYRSEVLEKLTVRRGGSCDAMKTVRVNIELQR